MLANHYHEALSLAEAAGLDTSTLRGPARKAFAEGAQRALSLGAGAAAHTLALEALDLAALDDPHRPQLQLLAAYAGRLAGTDDAPDLLQPAIAAFEERGDPGRAAEAAVLLGSDYFYRGEVAAVREVRDKALDLAQSAPASPAVARAVASAARSLLVLDRDFERALELARAAFSLADEAGDDETAAVALNTIGMTRVLLGDADGIDELEESVERAARGGSVFHLHSALNNLANSLWQVGRLAEGSARIHEARALCERYGFVSALAWNDAELVYDAFYRGDLAGVVDLAKRFFDERAGSLGYQERGVRATRAQALLARGQLDEAVADAELALSQARGAGADAQTAAHTVGAATIALRAAGRTAEAEELLGEILTGWIGEEVANLPLHLAELGRGEEFSRALKERRGHAWLEAGRAAARGDLVHASEIYGRIGARYQEAWAALLAAERGDTSRLDEALAYFEEQGATPYVQRCRALMQSSA